jgi:hypothetical protein
MIAFVPGRPLQPILMLGGKARSLPKSGVPERYFTQVGSDLTGNIDQAGKACQGQTWTYIYDECRGFYNIGLLKSLLFNDGIAANP